MVKRLAGILGLLLMLGLVLPLSVAALPASELWESYAAGVDANYEAYGNLWYGQTFTVDPESHSALQLRILAYREGSPGTVTISIRAVDGSDLPTGSDLTSGTFDGDAITTDSAGAWYGVTLTEYSLDYGVTYGIVIRAEAGDISNSLHIRYDGSSAGYTGGAEVTSANGGISWTEDTDDDSYFEVRGSALIELTQAEVYRGYVEDDDMLFVIQYLNTYTPYYPTQDSNYYFTLQLRSADGATIIAQTVCRDWGYKPGAIYLSADSASGLSAGTAYRLYIYSDITETPADYYTLTSADWRGDDITLLDNWILTTARDIADYYKADMTLPVASGEILNEEGSVIFAVGVAGLHYVRPNMFQSVVYTPEYTPEDWSDAFEEDTTWSEQIGDTSATALTSFGDIFGISGRNVGGLGIMILYIALCLVIVARGGDAIVGALLAIPVLLTGSWLHLLDIAFIAIIASIGVFLLLYRFWWGKTA